MKLESDRLIYRPITKEDFSNLYKMLSDKETMAGFGKTYDEDGVNRWINWTLECYKKCGFGLYAVILKSTGEFIGDAGITPQNINGKDAFEIGYHFYKDYWHNGYAIEAARFFKDYFFNNTNYDEVYSYMNINHLPSRRVAENNDMDLIDTYYDNLWKETLVVYKITRNKWKK